MYAGNWDVTIIFDEKGKIIYSSKEDNYDSYGVDPYGYELWFRRWNFTIHTTNKRTLKYKIGDEYKNAFLENGKIVLIKNDKWGVIDFKGKTLVDFNYDFLSVTSDGYAVVKVNDRFGVVDLKGRPIIPIVYEEIKLGEKQA
jgi:hypothetical protein